MAAGAVTLALGNLGRIPGGMLGGRAAPVVLNDLLLVPLWLTLLVVIFRRLRPWPVDQTSGWILAFIGVAVLSLVQAASLWDLGLGGLLGPAAFLVRWVLYAGWFWLVVVCLDADEARAGVRWIEGALLVIAIFGIVQSATLPGFAQLVPAGGADKGWDVQGRRLVSTLLDPNFAGILIVIALLLELARAAEGSTTRQWKLPVLSAAVLLTLSRSALLGLAAGTMVLVLARGVNRRLAGIVLAGALVLAPFLTILFRFAEGFNKLGLDASAAQRLIPWSRAIIMLRDHPWLGVGFNAVAQAQQAYGWQPIGGADVSLDGGLLFVATMTGITGAVLYVGLLASCVMTCRLVWRQSEDKSARALAAGTAASTVAVVVHSFFANSLLLPFVMQVLWVLWATVMVMSRPLRIPRRVPTGIVAALLAMAVTGCEPCSGVAVCTTSPTIALGGQVVEPETGAPASGVQVSVGGVRAVTGLNGRWELSFVVDSAVNTVDVNVQAPGREPYTVRGVTVRSFTVRGDAQELGRWTTYPFARYQGTLVRRGTPLGGAKITFTPTGGVATSVVGGSDSTNSAGIFSLSLAGRGGIGNALGTLTVTHPALSHPSRLEGFVVPVSQMWGLPMPLGPFSVGGRIDYGAEVVFRGTNEKSPQARITFVRTGGIQLASPEVRTVANERGFFLLPLESTSDGEVVGDLTLEGADGRFRSTYRGVRLATYDSTDLRSAGVFGFGERWAFALEFWRHDVLKPAPGVPVEFRRVGGLKIEPETLRAVTRADGRVEWGAVVRDTGTVIGEVLVFPADGTVRTIRNIRLRTYESDQLQFGGVYGFGPALRYVGEILGPGDRPVEGAQVTWTQTGGQPASPSSFTAATGSNGWFPLTLIPSIDGEVIGTLRVVPPAPWPPGTVYTLTNLRMNSWEDGDLRLAVTFRIPAP